MKTFSDLPYTEARHDKQKLDLYLPEGAGFKTVLYFHGGGIEGGSKEGIDNMATFLTDHGIALVSANYRLYPEAVYPEFIRDAAAATAWVFRHISEYGGSREIFVGGSSAGGYLSMMLCFDKKYLSPYGLQPTDIAGFLHDAGQPTVHYNVLRESGLHGLRVLVDERAPLYHVGIADAYPPMLFLCAENDMPGRKAQTELLIETMKNFGYTSKVTYHVHEGGHCGYNGRLADDGVVILAHEFFDFIESLSKS